MKFGIIIPFYNNFNFTNMCVASIRACSHDYQIIFIDNGSDLSTKKQMETLLKPNDVLITNQKNLGFAKAVNQGIRIAKGEWIIQMNNDIWVWDGWLEALIKTFEDNKNCGMAMPAIFKETKDAKEILKIEKELKYPSPNHRLAKKMRRGSLNYTAQ